MQPCQWLDDYLAHDLDGERHAWFSNHLAGCESCRRAVQEYGRLNALLTDASLRLEPVPADLVHRVRLRLHASRRRRVLAGAAALAAVLVFGWLLGRVISHSGQREPALVERRPEEPATDPQPVDVARIRFPAPSSLLTVPEAIDAEHVTFVWVYPGLREPSGAAPVGDGPELFPERSDP